MWIPVSSSARNIFGKAGVSSARHIGFATVGSAGGFLGGIVFWRWGIGMFVAVWQGHGEGCGNMVILRVYFIDGTVLVQYNSVFRCFDIQDP